MNILILLLAGHALCDYPLQGDFLACGKNHKQPLPGVPWWECLFAHAAIHAGMVVLVTGYWQLGVLEFLAHSCTDYLKSEGLLSFNADQSIHIAFKLAFALIVAVAQ